MSLPWRPRTVRMRLTLLYSGLFLGSSFVLLAITYLLVARHSLLMTLRPEDLPAPPDVPAGAGVSAREGWTVTPTSATLRTLILDTGIALAIMAGVSAGLGWWMAGRALRPLRTMAAATRRISERNLHERLAVAGPRDELTDLGETIDSLLARLEAAFEAERRFVANASHELRTPLTMMRTSVDVAEGKAGPVPPEVTVLAGKLREGLDLADRLLEGLLLLARAQHGAVADRTTVSLPALVASALEARAGAVAELDLTVERDGGPAAVCGNETLLARMVDNVVDNAVRHNQRAGWLRVATGSAGGYARLAVESGGPPLDQPAVEQLGQPFRRLGAERTSRAGADGTGGTGLGLSIVRAIAAAHSGRLTLRAREEGGLLVVVDLPLPSTPVPAPEVRV